MSDTTTDTSARSADRPRHGTGRDEPTSGAVPIALAAVPPEGLE